ncbi:MAG: hypothetical protein ACKO67_08375 [Bacteroidota bacterium]
MNKIYSYILDFPGMVNQKILNARLNAEIEQFDSSQGFKSYVRCLYQWLSVLVFLSMEWSILRQLMDYFSSDASGLAKAFSVITAAIMLYMAFPIAHVIRSRGESLGSSGSGMVNFLFRDFVTTNIRILGETAAIVGVCALGCRAMGFIVDNNLFCASVGIDLLANFAWTASLPMQGLNDLLGLLQLDAISNALNTLMSFNMADAAEFDGDMKWNAHHLVALAGGFVNVLMGLALMYVNLAIYGYLYGIVESLTAWVANPSLPISMKNK